MIIFGSKGNVVEAGSTGEKPCPVCEKPREFKHVIQYRYAHLYYIFGFITEKKHLDACTICNRGALIPAPEAKAALKSNPIPFTHRLGWTIPVVLIVVIFVAASLDK